jgi:hypothetical protein
MAAMATIRAAIAHPHPFLLWANDYPPMSDKLQLVVEFSCKLNEAVIKIGRTFTKTRVAGESTKPGVERSGTPGKLSFTAFSELPKACRTFSQSEGTGSRSRSNIVSASRVIRVG